MTGYLKVGENWAKLCFITLNDFSLHTPWSKIVAQILSVIQNFKGETRKEKRGNDSFDSFR